jgi:crotonobetainyl-CoA:carnitine CoA-transferase CaiB-like acyl-CoA transferase
MSLLDRYRVLDLSDERGLLAGRMLADLGADVVQVEPPGGSSARRVAPLSETGSYFWDTFAANKRGIVVDLTTEDGRHLVRRLALAADFLIESAGPGVLTALGLGWPDLREVNPALIYGTVTAFGHDGPKSGYAESDLVVWAAGRRPGRRPADRPPRSRPQRTGPAGRRLRTGRPRPQHAGAGTGGFGTRCQPGMGGDREPHQAG